MLFPTFTFACFFVVVLVGHWTLCDRPVPWKLFLLAASYVFYGAWDPRFVTLIVITTLVNQALAWAIHLHRSDDRTVRLLSIGTVVFNLGMLGFFKYHNFFAESLADTIGRIGIPSPPVLENLILPVGISFFTFQAMSYVIDVKRRDLRPAHLLDFALYLVFFPQLVAGPIVRGSEFLPQLPQVASRRRNIDLSRAVVLIGAGLFKKVVVSSYLAETIVDPVFAAPDRYSAAETLIAVYAYAIQIFADFSGYTDIAIGVALLLGFNFPQNFDRPYSAVSIQDFWRRWHMTLSTWLRDYLYISLGGNRGGASKRDRNLFLTMLLGGLWHGAAWTFVIWGAYHGIGLLVERRLTDAYGPLPTWAGRAVTFHFVCVGWIFFRATSVGDALSILGRILTGWGAGSPTLTILLVLVVALAIAVQYVPVGTGEVAANQLSRIPVGAVAAGFGLFLVLVDSLGPDGVAPFIYFQF